MKWELLHSCGRVVVATILRNFGFLPSEEEEKTYVKEVDNYLPFKALLTHKGIEFTVTETTNMFEPYLDYVMHCGVLVGQIMMCLNDATFEFTGVFQDLEDEEEEDDEDFDEFSDDDIEDEYPDRSDDEDLS
jgi:hypothetical protein